MPPISLTNLFTPAVPATPAAPVTPEAPNTPEPEGLDKWAKLAENKSSENNPSDSPKEVFDPVAILKDPESLDRISDSLDFTQSISAETQEKLANNAPDAMLSLVNDVGKAAYLQAIQHSSALSQQHVDDRFTQQRGQTKEDIQSGLGNYELEQALPEIKNPIIQLGIKSFVSELRAQTPNISGKDIATNVRGYLSDMHTALSPESSSSDGNKSIEEIDWLTEMGYPPTK